MVTVKRYYVFAGDNYYPNGAFGDFKQAFETHDEALELEKSLSRRYDWTSIEDILFYQDKNRL
jgi:hypothetical protein